MVTEISILLLLIVTNGLFTMGEMAILSARKSRLTHMSDEGNKGAQLALSLAANPTNFLSTIQTGITFINVMIGMFGGLAFAGRVSDWISLFPSLAPFAQSIGLTVSVAVVTYISLIIGELVPKRIALGNPEFISSHMARFMWLIARVCGPIVWFLSHSTHFFLWLLRIPKTAPVPVSDQEIRILMREGTASGQFEEGEQSIVMMALKLGDRRASTLMTPRTQMEVIDLSDPPAEIRAQIARNQQGRYPVVEGDLANLLGILEVRDFCALQVSAEADLPNAIRKIIRKPLFLPDTAPALKLFAAFKKTGEQMALIVDEYGDIEGLVTQTDLLEALVGDIAEQGGESQAAAVKLADGSWEIDGMLPIDELSDHIGIPIIPAEEIEESGVNTVGGFVMNSLKRIPRLGDQFEQNNVKFEVIAMHGRRVDKLRLTVEHPEAE